MPPGVHTSEVAAAESDPPTAAGVTRKKPSRLSPLVVLTLFPDSTQLLLLLCSSCCRCGLSCSCCCWGSSLVPLSSPVWSLLLTLTWLPFVVCLFFVFHIAD